MTSWIDKTQSKHKLAMRELIAGHVGWPDLRGGTWQTQHKFKVWYFWERRLGPRKVIARSVRLRY